MPNNRKPTKLKQLQGTARADRQIKNEMMPSQVDGYPEAPELLQKTKKAVQLWDELVYELQNLGMLHGVDLPLLASYCNEMSLYFELEKDLLENGRTFETPNGFKQKRPEVNMSRECLDRALKIAVQFGLTPSARTRISAPGKSDGDDLDKILG